MKAGRTTATAAAAAFLSVACAVVLRWLWSGVFLSEFQADTADNLFWAAAQREAGSLASPTFAYGYFIPLGGNLLIRPFLPVFGTGVTALRAGMTLFVPLFAFACYRLFRSFSWKRAESLFATALLFAVASASLKMREIHFGHVLYYSLGTVFLFLGCALAPDVRGNGAGSPRRARILRGALFALALGWAASCGQPLLLYAVVPVLGAWVLVRLVDREPLAPAEDGLRILPGAVGAVVGLVLFKALSRGVCVSSGYNDYYEAFSPLASWFRNVQILPQEWISLLEPLPRMRIAIASSTGLPHALRIATALFLGLAPVAALVRIRTFSVRERTFVVAHWILASEILFYWIFGNISNANWRLCPLVLSATAVAACLVRNGLAGTGVPVRRFAACGAAFLFAFCVFSFVQTSTRRCERNTWRGPETLLPTLERAGVRDGYCSDYWYANSATAVSGNRFRLREVRFNGKTGRWEPRLHNADARWYEPDPARTESVFVCHPNEEVRAPTNGLRGRFACIQKTARLGRPEPLVVRVYDGDCMNPARASDEP